MALKLLTEKQIERQILQWLNAQPQIFAFKINTTGIWDTKKKLFRKNRNPYIIKGCSDIIGVCNGLFFAIECKTKRGILTQEQTSFLLKVINKKGFAMKATCLDEVIAFITPILQAQRAR